MAAGIRIITPAQFLKMCEQAPLKFEAGLFKLKEDAGDMAIKLFENSFNAQKVSGSGGRTWKPRLKAYPWAMMNKTGRLKSSFWKQIVGDSVIIRNPVWYGKYHNDPNSKPADTPNVTYSDWERPWKRNQNTSLLITPRPFMRPSSEINRFVNRRLRELVKLLYRVTK